MLLNVAHERAGEHAAICPERVTEHFTAVTNQLQSAGQPLGYLDAD
jgi:hypothetical protein